jgi:hypothetical protein
LAEQFDLEVAVGRVKGDGHCGWLAAR